MGEKSPSRFKSQLGKANTQFSGADQQDAQEFLNFILDALHEDTNRVRKKPYVEGLEDEWVKKNTLPRVGQEAWRR
jgi:ubiquitin C-terminal hydrolase